MATKQRNGKILLPENPLIFKKDPGFKKTLKKVATALEKQDEERRNKRPNRGIDRILRLRLKKGM